MEADYFLNKSYIAKALCINREQPKIHCNGKCYLAKKLKEQEKQEQQVPVSKKNKAEVQLFYAAEPLQTDVCKQENKEQFPTTGISKLSSFSSLVFRPPSV